MLAVTCATIGSTANVLKLRKKSRRTYLNSYAVNASMHATHRSCSVCVVSHMMKRNFTSAVINVRTGFMAAAWAYCNVRRKTLTNTFVRIVNRIAL